MKAYTDIIVLLAVLVTMVAGWGTHVVHTIMEGEYLLLIAGAIFFPVGVVHGIGIWLGVW